VVSGFYEETGDAGNDFKDNEIDNGFMFCFWFMINRRQQYCKENC
jgi:hypothetical protein